MNPTQPYTVWHVLSNRWNSAIAEYALNAARSLEALGVTTIFSCLESSPIHPHAVTCLQQVKPLSSFSNLTGWREFLALAKQIQPQCIFTYDGRDHFFVQLFLSLHPQLGIRCIRVKGDDRFAKPWLLKLSHHHTHLMVVPSGYVANKAKSAFEGLSISIKTVELGLDIQRYFHVPANYDCAQRTELVILGRLDPVKGHREFLEIYSEFLDFLEDPALWPILHIIGEPANLTLADLHQAVSCHLSPQKQALIRITPQRLDPVSLRTLLTKAALGVVSSTGSELICRVTEEFLLCGTPVFMSDAGSGPDLLGSSPQFGRVFSYANPKTASGELLHELFLRAKSESCEQRFARSLQAKQRFSFMAMGAHLLPLLGAPSLSPFA